MYHSKTEIEKKLKKVKFVYNRLSKYKNKIFVNNGFDKETGTYPFLVDVSSFITFARSILQFAHKEAEDAGKLKIYNRFVNKSPILKTFKKIRDKDVHESNIGKHTTIYLKSPIKRESSKTDSGNIKNDAQEAKILEEVTIRIKPDKQLIKELEAQGEHNLVEHALKGNFLYQAIECDKESDIFILCKKYIDELEKFIQYGIKNGFIS